MKAATTGERNMAASYLVENVFVFFQDFWYYQKFRLIDFD